VIACEIPEVKIHFGMEVNLPNVQVEFVYQGVLVKVTAVKAKIYG